MPLIYSGVIGVGVAVWIVGIIVWIFSQVSGVCVTTGPSLCVGVCVECFFILKIGIQIYMSMNTLL